MRNIFTLVALISAFAFSKDKYVGQFYKTVDGITTLNKGYVSYEHLTIVLHNVKNESDKMTMQFGCPNMTENQLIAIFNYISQGLTLPQGTCTSYKID